MNHSLFLDVEPRIPVKNNELKNRANTLKHGMLQKLLGLHSHNPFVNTRKRSAVEAFGEGGGPPRKKSKSAPRKTCDPSLSVFWYLCALTIYCKTEANDKREQAIKILEEYVDADLVEKIAEALDVKITNTIMFGKPYIKSVHSFITKRSCTFARLTKIKIEKQDKLESNFIEKVKLSATNSFFDLATFFCVLLLLWADKSIQSKFPGAAAKASKLFEPVMKQINKTPINDLRQKCKLFEEVVECLPDDTNFDQPIPELFEEVVECLPVDTNFDQTIPEFFEGFEWCPDEWCPDECSPGVQIAQNMCAADLQRKCESVDDTQMDWLNQSPLDSSLEDLGKSQGVSGFSQTYESEIHVQENPVFDIFSYN